MKFFARGHENITANHQTTLEITKDKEITLSGDCIVGVDSDFNSDELKKFVMENERAIVILEAGGFKEEICGEINKEFSDKKEIVLRKTDFKSERTLMINCDKSAYEISPEFVNEIKDSKQEICIYLKGSS